MVSERAEIGPENAVSSELLQQAKALEGLVQRMMLAEQAVLLREVSQFGLTIPQFVTLVSINVLDQGTQTMGRVAEMAHQCSATMTGIIDRLEKMQLVERRNHPSDRRSVLVTLTDAGREKLEQIGALRRERIGRILAGIDPNMRVRVYNIMLEYLQALEKLTSERQ